MAQDDPADTAGPSSPPPRLPEGWLPQWEGVQRKWYYVQRATGKSQWEIPTEPVVLTPSTTPTSIGTGPSQAPPSRPSTNSPRVSGYGRTDERSGSAAENARISSSLGAQLIGQSGYATYGPSGSNWYTGQTSHHSANDNGYPIGTNRSEYGLDSSTGNIGAGLATFYQGHSHHQNPLGQQPLMRDGFRTTWDNSSDLIQGRPNVVGTDHGSDPDRDFLAERMSSVRAVNHLDQTQWQNEQHHMPSNNHLQLSSSQSGSSSLSQPFYGAYVTGQTVGCTPGGFVPSQSLRTLNPSLQNGGYIGNRAGTRGTHDSIPADSHRYSHQGGSMVGYSTSRSHSEQSIPVQRHGPYGSETTAQSSLHMYPSPATAYSQYQSTSMGRTQSGPGMNSLGVPATPETQGSAENYQNPLVQAGLQQYLPQQHTGYGSNGSVHTGPGHPYQAGASSGHPGQWPSTKMALRTATSDPQFVSGPWASSTPPHADLPRAPR